MNFQRGLKAPVEILRGKPEDLSKLKFIRKSEFSANVRHNIRYYASEMDRKLDYWRKEQITMIGNLKRDQDTIDQSRKRLHKERRRIKREEYLTEQENIRQKLGGMRVRLLMMKVVQKFKDNVDKKRKERGKQGLVNRVHGSSGGSKNASIQVDDMRFQKGKIMETIPEESDTSPAASAREEKKKRGRSSYKVEGQAVPPKLSYRTKSISHESKQLNGEPEARWASLERLNLEKQLEEDQEEDEKAPQPKRYIVVKLPNSARSDSIGSNEGVRGSDDDTRSNSPSSNEFNSDSWLDPSESSYAGSIHGGTKESPFLSYTHSKNFDNALIDLDRTPYKIQTEARNVIENERLSELPSVKVTFKNKLDPPLTYTISQGEKNVDSYTKNLIHAHGQNMNSAGREEGLNSDLNSMVNHRDRIAYIRDKMLRDHMVPTVEDETRNMTVFGTKADNLEPISPHPPNVPPTSPPKTPRGRMSVLAMNHKKAKYLEHKKQQIHNHELSMRTSEKVEELKRLYVPVPLSNRLDFSSMKDTHHRERLLKNERGTMVENDLRVRTFVDKVERVSNLQAISACLCILCFVVFSSGSSAGHVRGSTSSAIALIDWITSVKSRYTVDVSWTFRPTGFRVCQPVQLLNPIPHPPVNPLQRRLVASSLRYSDPRGLTPPPLIPHPPERRWIPPVHSRVAGTLDDMHG